MQADGQFLTSGIDVVLMVTVYKISVDADGQQREAVFGKLYPGSEGAAPLVECIGVGDHLRENICPEAAGMASPSGIADGLSYSSYSTADGGVGASSTSMSVERGS